MVSVNVTQLRAIAPSCRYPDLTATCLNEAMQRFGIAADVDFVRAFIAQLAVESGQFNRTVENLNYDAAGLLRTWPKRFTPVTAAEYARKPVQIANKVYADRLGNGNELSGDGWKYRGRGWIQVTGKDNTLRVLAEIGLPLTDYAQLEAPRFAALSAGAFWARKPQLNLLADDLPNDDDVADFFAISRMVNGGTIGIEERKMFWQRAKDVIA